MRKPWGINLTIISRPTWWLKILVVWGRTSLQLHSNRTEVIIGTRGVHIHRPFQTHRILWGLYGEFAYGAPTESDVLRIEDDYGR